MSGSSAPPGGYYIGTPANSDKHNELPPAAAEPPQAVNEPLPGDYFVGRPANQQQEAATPEPEPSFMAKCFPCLAPSKVAA